MKKTICLNPIIKKTSVIEAVEAGEWMRKTFMLDFVYHREFVFNILLYISCPRNKIYQNIETEFT